MECEKNALKAENVRASEEFAAVLGHSNKKQKIHYMANLKQQLNQLIEENASLRAHADQK